MTLVNVTVPGPSGTAISLANFGVPVANDINELITDLTPVLTAWTTYTPTWTSSGTQPAIVNGTLTGKYMALGKLGFIKGSITMGGSTTFGTGTYAFALPGGWTASGSTGQAVGSAGAVDGGVTNYTFTTVLASTTTVAFRPYNTATVIAATVPITWANTDVLTWQAVIELV